MPSATNEFFLFLFPAWYTSVFYTPSRPPPKLPAGQTIRFGLISAALINATAIIYPAQFFPEVEIVAVATRRQEDAVSYAKKWGIRADKAYGGYQRIIDDPEVDAVFIGLPNGLHAEWAVKALLAHKHVLVEKPSCSNAHEAREIMSALRSLTSPSPAIPNPSPAAVPPVFLEAFHYRFHPATVFVRSLLSSNAYGRLLSTYARLGVPQGALSPNNIRYDFELGGGALMDLAYTVSITRYMVLGLGAGKPSRIVSVNVKKLGKDERIDTKTEAEMEFDIDGQGQTDGEEGGDRGRYTVKSKIVSDLEVPKLWGFIPKLWELPVFVAETERAVITYNNFIMPFVFHSITIKNKETGTTSTEKVYSSNQARAPGERVQLMTTYGHQLDTFIKKVKGRDNDITPTDWIPIEDTVAQMETIDEIYRKAGMPVRNGSLYAEILRRANVEGEGATGEGTQ
ncbi:hypothetical protein BDZ91DRAFT_721645 [Kalaharituber pfeilii]|nr:hypothetical protein BDZ91DRAFT_721645 [Kalaharituber pfeilii]